jgi:hypothetical protein
VGLNLTAKPGGIQLQKEWGFPASWDHAGGLDREGRHGEPHVQYGEIRGAEISKPDRVLDLRPCLDGPEIKELLFEVSLRGLLLGPRS